MSAGVTAGRGVPCGSKAERAIATMLAGITIGGSQGVPASGVAGG